MKPPFRLQRRLITAAVFITLSGGCASHGPEPCCADIDGKWIVAYKDRDGNLQKAEVTMTENERALEGKGSLLLDPTGKTGASMDSKKSAAADEVAKSGGEKPTCEIKGTRDGAKLKFVFTRSDEKIPLDCEGVIDFVAEKKVEYRIHMAGKGQLGDKITRWEAGLP